MIKRACCLMFTVPILFWNCLAFGQTSSLSTPPIDQLETLQKEVLRDFYFSRTGFENDLIFGQEYYPYHYQSKGKPLFYTDNLYTASLVFDGKRYDNVRLQYDLYTDEVVYSDIELFLNFNSYQVALNEYLLESFSLYRLGDTLNFYYFDEGESNLPARFYEVVYSGKTRFLIKHYCSVYMEKTITEYKIKQAYYLDTGEGFYRFRGRHQFVKLFGDNGDDIREIMEQKDYKFEKNNKRSIAAILEEFDNQSVLTQQPKE